MAAGIECASCGAPAPAVGSACLFCGSALPAAPPRTRRADRRKPSPAAPGGGGQRAPEAIPDDLPPALEARRVRGLAVPVVSAAVVLGLGLPLTALAVSQVGRLPATTDLLPSPGEEEAAPGATTPAVPGGKGTGKARLSGAVVYEGAITPIGCTAGLPKLATFEAGAQRFSIIVNPPGVAPGGYKLDTATAAFVAVTKVAGGSQTWTSLGQPGAQGSISITANGMVVALFSGVAASGGGAEGAIEGALEMRCA